MASLVGRGLESQCGEDNWKHNQSLQAKTLEFYFGDDFMQRNDTVWALC